MRLVRDHIGLGSWLALMALALNLALSFGHNHASGGDQRNGVAVAIALSGAPKTGHHRDPCPICVATAAMGQAFASAAPALPHPVVQLLVDRAAEPVIIFVGQMRAAFQSRAPPMS
jgi:hypothetical protein